jgi:hypothetical protein
LLSALPLSVILLNVMAAMTYAITPLSITDCHDRHIFAEFQIINCSA